MHFTDNINQKQLKLNDTRKCMYINKSQFEISKLTF